MQTFVDDILNTVMAENSVLTLRIIGEVLQANKSNMTLTEDILLERLTAKAKAWFGDASGMEGLLFMGQICVVMANLAVGTRNATAIANTKQLFTGWRTQLEGNEDPFVQGFVRKLKQLESRILNSGRIDWTLMPE